MNSPLFFVLLAFALCNLVASAQSNVPGVIKLNMTINANTTLSLEGEPFLLTCEYEPSYPSREGQNRDQDWELTVAFHNSYMTTGSSDRNPIMGEFRQNGNNMTFHTVKMFDGVNIWPADGATTGLQSPKRVYIMPRKQSMWTYTQYRCSLTMSLKNSGAHVRFYSKDAQAQPA